MNVNYKKFIINKTYYLNNKKNNINKKFSNKNIQKLLMKIVNKIL